MKTRNEHPFLSLTYRERMGIFFILIFSIGFCFLPDLFRTVTGTKDDEIVFEDLTKKIFTSKIEDQISLDSVTEDPDMKRVQSLHFFDPNTTSETEWESLGLDDKTAKTIRRYVEKGGRFKKPEDLRKIWGLKEALYEQLLPFVRIREHTNTRTFAFATYNKKDTFLTKRGGWKNMSILINSADSAAWESLPGIGPALAHRIVTYREKLGGFVSVEQLREVWNLPDSVYQKIKPRLKFDEKIKKLDINQCGITEFGKHPYFGFRLAKLIVNYREQHGFFQSLEDIQKIALIDKNVYDKINPYLTIRTPPL